MILHGLFLCITSFAAGMAATSIFLSIKSDKRHTDDYDLLLAAYNARDDLLSECYDLKKENELLTRIIANIALNKEQGVDLIFGLAENPVIVNRIDTIIQQGKKIREISTEMEKHQCPE